MSGKSEKMTAGAVMHFAAPQTWPAAVLPSLLGACLAAGTGHSVDPWILFGILAVSVLLQSAVNTLNDYRDFVNGTDNPENCDDPEDAALIYDVSSPKSALILALAFMLAAAVIGVILLLQVGLFLLVFAGIGLAAILLYTMPGISFSRLPLGELLSGCAMGGAITLASAYAQTGQTDLKTVLCCIPAVITIGGILTVNNTCDIEKDIAGGRRTFSICVGRSAAQNTLRTALIAAAVLVAVEVILWFPHGAAALPVMAAGLIFNSPVRKLYTQSLLPSVRKEAMGGVLSAHKWIIGCFCAAGILQNISPVI